MKILFIYPNLYAQIGFNYGIAYLSAVLKQSGHETSLLNINEQLGFPLDFRRIKQCVCEYRPDLIAFSVVTNQYKFAEQIAADIRTYYDAPMICGGIHPTMDPRGVLNSGFFDYAAVGEGEGALCELAGCLSQGADTSAIKNIWTIRNGSVVANPVRPFIDLNTLPAKDYDIFEFQKMTDAKDGWVGLMTSRGCPFRCTYCLNHKIVEIYRADLNTSQLNYLRHHSVGDVIAEIDYLLSHYKRIRMFIFDDDLFTFNRAYLEQFCTEYRKNFSIPFVCNAHVKVFDESMARWLKDAGCTIVKFGLESGSERVRSEIMHRMMTNDEIVRAFDAAEKVGLHTSAFVMMGLPGETVDDLDQTVGLLGKIKPGRFRWAIFFPYINTESYHITERMGLIDEEKMNSLSNFTEESCLSFSGPMQKKIQWLQKMFPWYVNAASDLEIARLYKNMIDKIEQLSDAEWDRVKKEIRPIDKDLSRTLLTDGRMHYNIRYNEFTGVRSDWKG